MNLLRAILRRIPPEFRVQRLGRCSLREVQFARYKAAPRQGDLNVRERLLRRLQGRLELTSY